MNNNTRLFELIKEHKWDEFKKILLEDKEADVNIRDENGNYLIQYITLFNKVEFVSILIERGSRLDIIDLEGRSLLYFPIKYDYINMLETLLKLDNQRVGISLVDIQDKENFIPLHYAVTFGNTKAANLLLKYNSNPNITDNDGNNSLHLSVITKKLDICKMILKYNINVNMRNKFGESPLHIACNYQLIEYAKILLESGADTNIKEYEIQLTPLMYAITLGNTELTNLLLKYKADVKEQDLNGNHCMHYSMIEGNHEIIHKILPMFDHLNDTNVDGKTVAHIALERNNYNTNKLDNFLFKEILIKTNINIQDNDSNTILYLLVKNDIWKHYSDILATKKCNIYIGNQLELIKKEDLSTFYDVVSRGYLYTLRDEKNKDVVWMNKWEMDCKTGDDKECLKKIKNFITKNRVSVPIKKRGYCIEIKTSDEIEFPTYTGRQIDIIFGLLYLQKKHSGQVCTSLTEDFIKNPELDKYYDSLGLVKSYKIEYLNFEVIWAYQKLFFPTNFDQTISTVLNNKCRFIIIPLGIELTNGSHANILIYDKNLNEIERFESYGSDYPYGFNYNPSQLDIQLERKFRQLIPNSKYIKPSVFLPKIGFQYLESYIYQKKGKIGDPGGFCAAWSAWYADKRITHKDVDRTILVKKLIRKIRETDTSFRNLIRNYTGNITSLRDELFGKMNININDWKNENISDEDLEKFNSLLGRFIQETNKL